MMPAETMTPAQYNLYLSSGRKKVDRTKQGAKAKGNMHWVLVDLARRYGLTLIRDHQFHPIRKWKADWAVFGEVNGRQIKIIVEYEGTISEKARHTTIKGYSGDCRKYTAAAVLGWMVLRYTVLTFEDLSQDLKAIFLTIN